MLSVDMKNAVEGDATNFSCQLFRLLLKADSVNRAKLGNEYPIEVKMVHLYRGNCIYKKNGEVDFIAIEKQASL